MSVIELFRKFRDDDSGSSTIEFLIWLPLLSFWLVFSSALFIAWDNRSNVAKAAYTVSDLVSRREEVSTGFLTQIEDLNDRLVARVADESSAKVRVSSIMFGNGEYVNGDYVNGELFVTWSCGANGLLGLEKEDIPVDLIPQMSPLDTIILTETYVPYTPIPVPFSSTFGGLEALEWANALITRPRIVREITFKEGELCPDGSNPFDPGDGADG